MFKLVALFALVAVASAAVIDKEKKDVIPILKSDSEVKEDGSYLFSYEGGDGTVREEKGSVVNPGDEKSYVAMVGSYRYIDADGQTVEVHYTADEHGFVPTGTIIHEAVANAAKIVSLNPKVEE
ncbi:unnamed protein product [Hermetia illucens]|uniref:Uncharacterized protein n=1 Tax=Hermetia illucens TaxID=343691 RepID=A0A7R8YL45_HERIL|nr:endocuticle structural glycoprotein SgAbd-9-like [Hermetia illucens]CAD7076738.1 unnamed protein product [Hermetia illucens]